MFKKRGALAYSKKSPPNPRIVAMGEVAFFTIINVEEAAWEGYDEDLDRG